MPGKPHGMIARYRARAAVLLEEGGPGLLLARVAKKLVSPLADFGSIFFFSRELVQNFVLPTTGVSLELRRAWARDVGLVLEGCDPRRSAVSLLERFQRGDSCFIAVDAGGRVANSRWVGADGWRRIPELEMDLVLRPGEAYTYDTYTRPDMRGHGIDGLVRCFMFNALRAEHFRNVFSYVRRDNPLGLSATGRWQRRIGRVWYFRARGSRTLVAGANGAELPLLQKPLGEAASEFEVQSSKF